MKYLSADNDRHGKPRLYWRPPRPARKIRLSVLPGHPEFDLALLAAKQGLKWIPGVGPERPPERSPQAGTLAALVLDFYAAPDFATRLDPSTQTKRKHILESCLAEPVRDGSPDTMGACPLKYFTRAHVERLVALKRATPEAANGRRKALRRLFNWAIRAGRVTQNPCAGVESPAAPTEGHHTWSVEEVQRYWARWPVGTKARLVMDLFLFTGLRISDAARLGRPHVRDGFASIPQTKNARRRRTVLEFPILPALRASIDACPSRGLTFIETESGKPHSPKGLGNSFRAWCDAAGLHHCSAHGLRKAGATILAENGATDHQLMAVFGWSDIRQAQIYTKAASRRRMAGQAMGLLMSPFVSPESPVAKSETKTG